MATPTRRALLIGIDYYAFNEKYPHRKYKNLGGCVNDVNAIDKFLQSCEPRCITTKLTATCKDGKLVESEDSSLPTYQNIVHILTELSEDCQPGDLIYIHYSGHGIRRDKKLPDDGGNNLMGTALVPTDALVSGKYLTGYHLGLIVQEMVNVRKARVCVVLDSCFSGGGFRDTNVSPSLTPREVDLIGEEDDTMKDSDAAADVVAASLPGYRNTTFTVNWFTNPTGCTVITACGSNQTAGEDVFEGTEGRIRQGALTHWMLDLLGRRDWIHLPTYARIREHVHLKTRVTNEQSQQTPQSHKSRQTPLVRGDSHFEFFGNETHVERPACHVLGSSDDGITLDVGSAQGVCVGAIYNIYPDPVSSDEVESIQIRITTTHHFQSEGVPINQSSRGMNRPIPPGSRAMLQGWALTRTVGVRLLVEDSGIRSAFQAEIGKTPNLHLTTNYNEPAEFVVSPNSEGNFEVQERGRRVPRLPTIKQEEYNAARKIGYVIRHLARYRAIEALLSHPRRSHLKDDDFSAKFRRRKASSTREEKDDIIRHPEDFEDIKQDEAGRYRTKEGGGIWYTLGYHGPFESLWLALFELNASWGVEKRFPPLGRNAEEIWPVQREPKHLLAIEEEPEHLEITATIPPKCARSDPDDTVDKMLAFVASGSHAPSWDGLALPPLPVDSSLLPLDATNDEDLDDSTRSDVKQPPRPEKRDWYITSFEIHAFPDSSQTNPDTTTELIEGSS